MAVWSLSHKTNIRMHRIFTSFHTWFARCFCFFGGLSFQRSFFACSFALCAPHDLHGFNMADQMLKRTHTYILILFFVAVGGCFYTSPKAVTWPWILCNIRSGWSKLDAERTLFRDVKRLNEFWILDILEQFFWLRKVLYNLSRYQMIYLIQIRPYLV